jgi:N-acylneuraminate cytidylyltransferase
LISYAFIFARGGSKRVINKNIRLLAGKPLIVHAINLATSIKSIDKVFVSTEDQEISKFATESLVEVIPRPTELAQDDAPIL